MFCQKQTLPIHPCIAIRAAKDAELWFANSAASHRRFKFSLHTVWKHPTHPLSLNISGQSVQWKILFLLFYFTSPWLLLVTTSNYTATLPQFLQQSQANLYSLKDGAYYCYCKYVLCILIYMYLGFLHVSVMLTYNNIFARFKTIQRT